MKRLTILLLASVLLFACNNGSESSGEFGHLDLRLDIDQSSRVALENNRYVWQGDEQLGIYLSSTTPTSNLQRPVEVRDGVGYASVEADYKSGDMLYAYMPYNSQSGDVHSVKLTIPSQQSVARAGDFPGTAMPMVAEARQIEDNGKVALRLYPLGSFLCYNIYASGDYALEKVLSVRYATSKAIAGTVSHDISSAELSLAAMSEYSVTTTLDTPYSLSKGLDGSTPIYMVVAPGEYAGTLTVTTDAAIYSYNYEINTARNKYYNVNIDLSKAQYRKSLGGSTTSATATC